MRACSTTVYIQLFIFILGFTVAIIFSKPLLAYSGGYSAMLIGSCLLFMAKWPLYRQKKIFSLGPSPMNRLSKILYTYALIVFIPGMLIVSLRILIDYHCNQ